MCGFIAAALIFGIRLLSIGTAYKAKMLCSEVFVAGRNPDDVLADLELDDLKALRVIEAKVDRTARTAFATSLLGIVGRQARFRGDVGCAVVFGGDQQPAVLEASPRERRDESNDPAVAPRNQRLEALLDEAFSEPETARPRRTRAVIVVHDGRIVAERYAAGIRPDTPLLGWSLTKSVLNALVGILVGEGRLSLASPVSVQGWNEPGDARRRITLDNLMRMSSGLRFEEDMTHAVTDVTNMLLRAPDMAAFAANKMLDVEPGTRWQYSSGTSLIIARIMRDALGDHAYRRYPRAALFDRIGMSSAILETDASGTFVGSSFMYATARDWARFGMLYLNDGVWNGGRILPEGWVDYTRTPAPTDPHRAYGAHFWLRIPVEYNGTKAVLPRDAFHAAGHEGQLVTVVASRGAVIVRLGKTRYADAWDHGAFVRDMLAALSEQGG